MQHIFPIPFIGKRTSHERSVLHIYFAWTSLNGSSRVIIECTMLLILFRWNITFKRRTQKNKTKLYHPNLINRFLDNNNNKYISVILFIPPSYRYTLIMKSVAVNEKLVYRAANWIWVFVVHVWPQQHRPLYEQPSIHMAIHCRRWHHKVPARIIMHRRRTMRRKSLHRWRQPVSFFLYILSR